MTIRLVKNGKVVVSHTGFAKVVFSKTANQTVAGLTEQEEIKPLARLEHGVWYALEDGHPTQQFSSFEITA